jgi:F-type H+-transporting ATPase subunit b
MGSLIPMDPNFQLSSLYLAWVMPDFLVKIYNDLRPIVIAGVPTMVVVILLHWYMKKTFFEPLGLVMDERRNRTQGAMEQAEAIVLAAEEKAKEYEKALMHARAEIFKEQDAIRRQMLEEQAKAVQAARQRMTEQVDKEKAGIVAEAEAAKVTLSQEVERLAEQITDQVLTGRAA